MTDQEILNELSLHRKHGTLSSSRGLQLINELIDRGVYPASTPHMVEKKSTHIDMIKWYSPTWHEYPDPRHCPKCKINLDDTRWGPPFSRVIIYCDWFADVGTEYGCPMCKHTWSRHGREERREEEKKA